MPRAMGGLTGSDLGGASLEGLGGGAMGDAGAAWATLWRARAAREPHQRGSTHECMPAEMHAIHRPPAPALPCHRQATTAPRRAWRAARATCRARATAAGTRARTWGWRAPPASGTPPKVRGGGWNMAAAGCWAWMALQVASCCGRGSPHRPALRPAPLPARRALLRQPRPGWGPGGWRRGRVQRRAGRHRSPGRRRQARARAGRLGPVPEALLPPVPPLPACVGGCLELLLARQLAAPHWCPAARRPRTGPRRAGRGCTARKSGRTPERAHSSGEEAALC